MSLGFDIRQWKLDFSINTAWSNEGRIKGLNSVCSHDDFDISSRVEAIKLIQKFQHSPLDFTFSTRCRFVPQQGRNKIQ